MLHTMELPLVFKSIYQGLILSGSTNPHFKSSQKFPKLRAYCRCYLFTVWLDAVSSHWPRYFWQTPMRLTDSHVIVVRSPGDVASGPTICLFFTKNMMAFCRCSLASSFILRHSSSDISFLPLGLLSGDLEVLSRRRSSRTFSMHFQRGKMSPSTATARFT